MRFERYWRNHEDVSTLNHNMITKLLPRTSSVFWIELYPENSWIDSFSFNIYNFPLLVLQSVSILAHFQFFANFFYW
jgi:hypothetical protein